MLDTNYQDRRFALKEYFDRTAVEAWARMTSDAPLSRVRETVRRGRDAMRATLLAMLPDDMTGARLLDAGCGTGALAVEAARRGADVVAVDLSPNLVDLARERCPADVGPGRILFVSGDMLAADLGAFDFAVAMDSLIHYDTPDVVTALGRLADRTSAKIAFTFAPRTPMLSTMHAAGKLFPRSDRAPAIVPHGARDLRTRIAASPALADWSAGESQRIKSGFYISEAMEIARR
ncbi:MAG: magnesium protoporphyrin IX methyltransferase [Pseudomonadota bacterium]